MKRVFSVFPSLWHRATSRILPSLKSATKWVCASVACGALLACTPSYDWRTVMNNDDGYEVTLPAKPRSEERQIEIAGVFFCASQHARSKCSRLVCQYQQAYDECP